MPNISTNIFFPDTNFDQRAIPLFDHNYNLDRMKNSGMPVFTTSHINQASQRLKMVDMPFKAFSTLSYDKGFNITPTPVSNLALNYGSFQTINFPHNQTTMTTTYNPIANHSEQNSKIKLYKFIIESHAKIAFARFCTLLDDIFLPVNVRSTTDQTLVSLTALYTEYKTNSLVKAETRFFDWRGFGKTANMGDKAVRKKIALQVFRETRTFAFDHGTKGGIPIFMVDSYTFDNIVYALYESNVIAKEGISLDDKGLTVDRYISMPFALYSDFMLLRSPHGISDIVVTADTWSITNAGSDISDVTKYQRILKPAVNDAGAPLQEPDPSNPAAAIPIAGAMLGTAFHPSALSISISDLVILNYLSIQLSEKFGKQVPSTKDSVFLGLNGCIANLKSIASNHFF